MTETLIRVNARLQVTESVKWLKRTEKTPEVMSGLPKNCEEPH